MIYCTSCDKENIYHLKSQRVNMKIRGIFFNYVEQTAYCNECGEEVYVPEINDSNATAREKAYRAVGK